MVHQLRLAALVVVFGDWGWVFDDDDTTTEIDPIAGVFTLSAGCTDLEVTATEITFTCPAATPDATVTVDTSANVDPADPLGAALATLPGTNFAATVNVKFDGYTNGTSPEGLVAVLTNSSTAG